MLLVAMGFGISCADDGIDDGGKTAVDSIAALDYQVAAMKQSVKDIQALEGDFSEAVDAIGRQISFIESGASQVEGSLATLSLQKDLAAIFGTDDVDLETINAGISAWMGSDFKEFYPLAVAQTKINAVASSVEKQKAYAEALSSDVESGIKKDENPSELAGLVDSVEENGSKVEDLSADLSVLLSEVEAAYKQAITKSSYDSEALKQVNKAAAAQTKAVDDSYAGLVARVAACEALIVQISERLGALEDEIEDLKELLGLIQSLSFVSEYSNDKAIAYYNLDLANRTYDDVAQRNPTSDFTLDYIVRPASAAAALADPSLWNNGLNVYAYYAQAITKAPILYNLKIEDVTVSSNAYGIISVKVKNAFDEAFYYKKTGAKVALSVATGKTDFTTDFVEVMPKDASSTVYVESLELPSDYIELDDGQSKQLNLTIAPSNVTDRDIVWNTSDINVVQVSGTGQIVAKGVGTAVITATSKSVNEWGNKVSASCTVKVNPAIRLSGPSYVEVGKSVDLMLDYPGSMQVESRVWTSSDNSKATVTSAGVVTGVGNTYNLATNDYGTVTISCTVNGLTTLSHEMKVVVTQPTSIKLNNYADNVSEITIKVDQSLDLGATIVPEVPADQFRLFYQSTSASGLGWVDSHTGKINEYRNTLPIENVYVYIDVMNYDKNHYFAPGRSLRRTVLVKVQPYYIKTIKLDDLDMQPGTSAKLNPKFTSDVDGVQPTDKSVEYSSSNTSIATVDAEGNVHALSAGQVIITARSKNDASISGTCTITVTVPWKEFDVGQYILNNNGEIEFTSTVTTANKSKIIGVVIAKTNPRVSDTQLPSDCTHGIAVALGGHTSATKWWSTSPGGEPYNLYKYYISNYNTKGYGDPRGIQYASGAYTQTEVGKQPSGYSNTEMLRDLLSLHGLSSDMLKAVDSYNVQRPNGTSKWYIPSVYEMCQIYQCYKNNGLDSLLTAAGGTGLYNWDYWTVSETMGNENSNVAIVNPMTGKISSKMKTSTSSVPYIRYIIAF